MDPIRFRKLLTNLIKLLVVVELISALASGMKGNGWERLSVDLIVAGVLYLAWDQIKSGLELRKEFYRKRMEESPQQIGLKDAFIFSLLSSDEIYRGIPDDRRRLVVLSYTLITLGVVAAYVKIGSGYMPLAIAGALVLAAVNLVVWIVSLERGVRESLHTELKLAHDVQMSLMPREEPCVECFDIAGLSIPAREVGGDFYDYASLVNEQGPFGISVFDVSGKGLQAAMSAVFTSGAYASEIRLSSSPAEILTRLNRSVFRHSRRGHFIAFLMAALNQSTGEVVFANAGQTRPLLRTGGAIQTLDAVGVHFPLGMKEDTVYEERSVTLRPGDMMVLLTDGFTDAMNGGKEQFGMERIERALLDPALAGATSRQVIDALCANVKTFTAETPQHDDMTMVVVRRL